MSFRIMRILVFFDLPSTSSNDLRNYRKFRKYLINEGFIMVQESVYCKLALNKSAQKSIINKLKANKPEKGNILALPVTEKQYLNMEIILGELENDVINTTERIIVI